MRTIILILTIFFLASCGNNQQTNDGNENESSLLIGTLEIVAELDINPGNVAVSKNGRVFTSVHPMRAQNVQLIEVLENNQYQAFPDTAIQSTPSEKSDEELDTPLGIIFDKKDRLWVIDAGLNLGKTRVFAFDINSNEMLYRFDVPEELAPANSFVQDLAIDEENGFVYLADFGNPGIIVINTNDSTYRKVSDSTMYAEDKDIIINDEVLLLNGEPARIGLNPLTLSENRETLFFGAMSGSKWYRMATAPIKDGSSDDEVLNTLEIVGNKPFSDGVATDENGNHYITNIQNSSIDILSSDGALSTLIEDSLLDWPDNVRIQGDWLYIAVNQLHKAPAFTGGEEKSTLPYRIVRVRFR